MPSVSQAPVSVSPEAAAYAARLGVQDPLQEMIDKALQIIPGVRRLQVSLQYSHDGDIPRILLDAIVPPETEDFSAEDRWWAWRHDQFPPSVLEHFCLLMIPDFPDAR